MTTHISHLPLGLDPLIAEAKQRTRRRRLLLLAALAATAAVAVGLVLALRPPSPSTAEISTGSASGVSSFAPCTKLALGNAVSAAGRAEGFSAELVLVNGRWMSCSNGWAAAMANVGLGTATVTETFVFHSDHHAWRRQLNRARVCGTHRVPRAIYWLACETN